MVINQWKHHIIDISTGFAVVLFNNKGIHRLFLRRDVSSLPGFSDSKEEELPWPKLKGELKEYFFGREITGDYPLIWDEYSSWTLTILRLTRTIPYGRVITYKQLAEKAGTAGGARAAGQALSRNRTPLLIPCHRVIGENGKLVGFNSGIEWKKELLTREGSIP
ncbi:MAG: methylated-DNA--[protein]-cysteine S-methyltransferase [Bacillota bacterium]|nr:methylated-DNA--[protein]-cysteine S-methyltransferase [Bacillota bacterium]